MKKSIFLITILMGLSMAVNSQNQQLKSVTGTFVKANAFEASFNVIFENESGKEISFSINGDYKINGKNIIKYDPTLVDHNKPGFSGDDGYIANPEFVNKKMKVTYKLVKVSQEEKDRGIEDYEQVVKLELISSDQGQTASATWMVIFGSFKTQNEAINSQKQFMTKYQLQTEVLNSNNFQNLTKDLFIVVGGKNLTNVCAKQLLDKIKGMKIEGYIKDGGLMK
ncbi:MAG: hypothetical protein ABSD71_00270 [Bacteroidales bacterium]|jgi:hypothetical protein